MAFWSRKKAGGEPSTPTGEKGSATALLDPPRNDEDTSKSCLWRSATERDTEGELWFSREEVLELRGETDEKALLAKLTRRAPMASREEVLFRYHLSRSLRLGDYALPVLPRSATQILGLGRDPRAEVKDYARVIGADPSLICAIIGTANSSFFASLAEVTDLQQAIVRIGLSQVERIVVVHAMSTKLLRVRGLDSLVREEIDHGLRTAVACQVLGNAAAVPPSDAFLAGLFHDVGKLVLLALIDNVQRKLRWQAPRELVLATFAAFHVGLGHLACHEWGLPQSICQAISNHHDAERARHTPLDRTVYLGNLIAQGSGEFEEEESTQPQAPCLADALGLNAEELAMLMERVEAELEAYAGLNPSAPAGS